MKTETPSVKIVAITADEAGQRIDNFLRTQLKGVPKSMIYRILRKGEVRVNKKRIKPEYKLEAGDEVRIPPVRVAEREEEAINRHVGFSHSMLFRCRALIIICCAEPATEVIESVTISAINKPISEIKPFYCCR